MCLTYNWRSSFGEHNKNGLVTLFFVLHNHLADISEAFPEDNFKKALPRNRSIKEVPPPLIGRKEELLPKTAFMVRVTP